MSVDMRESEHEIDLSSDLASFFQHLVDEVVKRQEFAATEAAEYYLAHLLADYAKPEKLEA
ncbi:MAG TPA: hypothetical protein VGM44_21210, partial [Polyangiaceae bacterium]